MKEIELAVIHHVKQYVWMLQEGDNAYLNAGNIKEIGSAVTLLNVSQSVWMLQEGDNVCLNVGNIKVI